MAEQTAETRFISGNGLLRVPSSVNKPRYISLLVSVVRLPRRNFSSAKYSPVRQRFCTLVFMRDGVVIEEKASDYPRRRFDFIPDIAGQGMIATKCSYEGVLQTFVNFANALALPVISVTNLIKDFENLNFLWDEVRVVCEPEVLVEVKLLWDGYASCNDENNKEKKPPVPPPPPTSIPPGQPSSLPSPPYAENDDITDPDSLDDVPPGQGSPGSWLITWTYSQNPGEGACPFLGSPDTIIRQGTSTDVFGTVITGTGGQRVYRLTQNGVPDSTALVEVGCFPNFQPAPVFTPGT